MGITYASDAYTKRAPMPSLGHAGELKYVTWTINCNTAPTTADALYFGYMPTNAVLKFATIKASDMDSGGSSLAFHVGDKDDPDRLFSGINVAGTGNANYTLAATGLNYKYPEKTAITGTVTANAVTPAQGSITLTLFYAVEP